VPIFGTGYAGTFLYTAASSVIRFDSIGQGLQTIGIIGSGDMGSGVAAAFSKAGFRVVTNLSGRSAHSRALAERAGTHDVGSLGALLGQADIVLSIVPPAAAAGVARQVAAQLPANRSLPFADCNAVSPATLAEIAAAFPSPDLVLDVGIVGAPPQRERGRGTRFFVAGNARALLTALHVPGIEMIDLGAELGRASALKMTYAAINKGVDAMLTAILLAAERLGVRRELMAECASSQAPITQRMAARLPFLAATAARFAPEMREIAATFASVGVTPDLHRGAAWVYDLLAESSLSAETRASLPAERSLDEAIRAFAAALDQRFGPES
jgi:3-hydroxyisobutyrate dehydrogenase-like beta-hydroxyacid dehydrogenase